MWRQLGSRVVLGNKRLPAAKMWTRWYVSDALEFDFPDQGMSDNNRDRRSFWANSALPVASEISWPPCLRLLKDECLGEKLSSVFQQSRIRVNSIGVGRRSGKSNFSFSFRFMKKSF